MQGRSRRALVLSHEEAGHPFRRTLPRHVFADAVDADPDARENARAARQWRMSGSDWRGFLSAYCAGLVVFGILFA